MSILPSFLTEISEATETGETMVIDPPKEYGIDFSTGQLTGAVVEGIEAVKVWIWSALRTQRFRYPIYAWQYGIDMDQYIGEVLTDEYLETDLQNEISDTLTVNPYITGISDYTFTRSGSQITATLEVETTLGQKIEEELKVNL